jgi:hypothetical protein
MLNEEQPAFIKAMSRSELSSVFLRQLRAMAAAKKDKVPATSKANAASDSALERVSGVESEDQTSRDFPLLLTSKQKAEELSNSDCPSEPTSRRPAPRNPFDDGSEAQSAMGEIATKRSRQLGLTEGELAYAALVAGYAGTQQPSRTRKPPDMGSGYSEPTASSEAAQRHMSQGEMPGPLCGMPGGPCGYECRFCRRAAE